MSGTAERIVVGVDGSPASKAALEWAVKEAELRGAAVHVVMAWQLPVVYNPPNIMAVSSLVSGEDLAAAATSEVQKLAQEVGREGGASVIGEAMEGHPAEVLISAATKASLLVVGSRGHGGFVGALLGSVSQHVVAHAVCPVVVVPDPDQVESRARHSA